MPRALVTGATGFIGRALLRRMERAGWDLIAAARHLPAARTGHVEWRQVGELSEFSAWPQVVQGADCVVHLAARAHVLGGEPRNAAELYDRANAEVPVQLARAAAAAGVMRFVFVSSIGVNGIATSGRPFSEDDPPRPQEDYARSKWRAESGLREFAATSGLELVILRPPLVYGPEAPGNFGRVAAWLRKGYPMPLASVANLRSFIFVENLADAIMRCLTDKRAVDQLFLLSDGEDLSTPDLIRRMARAADLPDRLWPCPPALLRVAGRLTGRTREVGRLLDSLQVDSSRIRSRLAWQPPFSVDEGLALAMVSGGGLRP